MEPLDCGLEGLHGRHLSYVLLLHEPGGDCHSSLQVVNHSCTRASGELKLEVKVGLPSS